MPSCLFGQLVILNSKRCQVFEMFTVLFDKLIHFFLSLFSFLLFVYDVLLEFVHFVFTVEHMSDCVLVSGFEETYIAYEILAISLMADIVILYVGYRFRLKTISTSILYCQVTRIEMLLRTKIVVNKRMTFDN